ncbi:MAG: selenium-dependent molybdenum cofactor biosynthesis protein YqeB [Thermodesulfobacteriota bacterium]
MTPSSPTLALAGPAWSAGAGERAGKETDAILLHHEPLILIKGAGDMASGVAHRLHQAHLRLVMTEVPQPLAVRRSVSFCEAVHDGRQVVEGVEAARVADAEGVAAAWSQGRIPLLVDPDLACLAWLKPDVLVEATLAKRNLGLNKDLAPLVIALGPGFQAGVDAHLVVETLRGHDLGRIYDQGWAIPNTGAPAPVDGVGAERVLRAPADGVFAAAIELGAVVEKGQEVGRVAGRPVLAGVAGVVRGLIRPGATVRQGLKIGDVDPRGRPEYLHTISDKARALGGAVLEAILRVYNRPKAD